MVCLACTSKEKMPDDRFMKEGNKIIVYQLLPRLFGNTVSNNIPFGDSLQNGLGKFNDISSKALQEIKALGATHVWYTGVIEHATTTDYSRYGIVPDDADVVKGRAGSPFAVKDYYDVDPDLARDVPGRMREFEELVSRTHEQELKVIIDFVANHVARTCQSDAKPEGVRDLGQDDDNTLAFHPSNNFYYLPNTTFYPPPSVKIPGLKSDRKFLETPSKATGNDKFTDRPEVNDWYETVKLNYGVDILAGNVKHFDPIPNTWIKMRNILLFWANKKVDGFRCDIVEMVPLEFWKWVIPEIKKVNPSILFIAEIYSPTRYREFIQEGHFDFLYDKGLYDDLRRVLSGKQHLITAIINDQSDISAHLLRFMENHDEQRLASPLVAGNPWKAMPAMAISTLIDKASCLIYFGQEVGEEALRAEGFSGDDGRTTIFDYWGMTEFQKWVNDKNFDGGKLSEDQKKLRRLYARLLNFAKSNEAVITGDFIPLPDFEGVYAFLRVAGHDKVLVIVNFSDQEVKKNLQLSAGICEKAAIFNFQKLTGSNIFTKNLIEFGYAREKEILLAPYFVGVYVLSTS